MKKVYVWGL